MRAVGDLVVDCSGHHHHRHMRLGAPDLRQRLEAVEAGHVVVEEDQAEMAAADLAERGDAFARFVHVEREAAGRQDLAHDGARGAGIVDDQHAGRDLGAGAELDQPARVVGIAGLGHDAVDVARAPAAARHRGKDQRRRARRARGRHQRRLVGIVQLAFYDAQVETVAGKYAGGGPRLRRRQIDRHGRHRRALAPQLLLRRRRRHQQHAERNEVSAHGPCPSRSGS